MDKDLDRWNDIALHYWKDRSDSQKWLHDHVLYPAVLTEIEAYGVVDVLDYGCSDGCFLLFAQDHGATCRLFAYDKAIEMRHLARVNIRRADAVLDALGNRKFDCVVLNMVLQAVCDYAAVIRSVKRHLKKDGVVIVTIPNFEMAMEHGEYATARHEIIELHARSDESVEKMFWVDGSDGWTYKYNRRNETYIEGFASEGFTLIKCYSPKPVLSGKTNLGMYEYNSRVDETVLMVYRREEKC